MTYQPYTTAVLSRITANCEGCQSPTPLWSLTIVPARSVGGRGEWHYECATCSRDKTVGYAVCLVDFLNGGETILEWSTRLSGALQVGAFLDCFYRLRTAVLSIIEVTDEGSSPWADAVTRRVLEGGLSVSKVDGVFGHGKVSASQKHGSVPLPRGAFFQPGGWGLAVRKGAYSRAAIALGIVAALMGATAAVRPMLDNVHPVVPGAVYRSGQLGSDHLEAVITRYHIRSVLNLRGARPGSRWYDDEVATAERDGVEHVDVELSPERDVPASEAERLVRLMDALPKPVLIHSQVGADRSGLVAALYRFARIHDGASAAAAQLSAWYGHIPLLRAKTAAMDRSFWAYVQSHRPG